GDGLGPTLEIGTATVHIQGGAEINIRDQDTIVSWLSPINFFPRQQEILQMQQPGTGGWLLKNPHFEEWKSGSTRTLWCHGIPGAGKTVLAAMVVDHLSADNRNIGVACIYLNHKEVDSQTPPKLLAALWRQLVLSKDIGSDAKELYKQHSQKGTSPSPQEIAGILTSSLKEFSQVFIVIDAIDEYPEDQRFILLKHLTEQMHLSLSMKLMVTSRPHVPVGPTLPNVETLEIGAMPEDIQKFVNAQIDSLPRLSKHVQGKPSL
ncbi:hypothetical protein DFH08DRAFT_447865, partial [Mycena albidolilacea]